MSAPSPKKEAPLRPEAISELRHELRTPVNLIVGYCEMLLEDAADQGREERSAPIERALEAVRGALDQISAALPSSGPTVTARNIESLYSDLTGPRDEIVASMDELARLGGSAGDGDREAFASDVRKVRDAAERLTAVDWRSIIAGASPELQSSSVESGDAASPRLESAPAPSGASARILVVDDIEENRDVLGRRLGREGYDVDVAENGAIALEKVRVAGFDLVLLDIMMPELDGYQVLERLKGDAATRDIPVIMISALDELASVVRCIEAGAEDYLPKPFDPTLLRARIGACLEKKRLRDLEKEYLDQVSRVISAAAAVETGDYESGALTEVGSRDDELGKLARVFDHMATEVRAREERLVGQVSELQAEIEAARKSTSTEGAADTAPVLPTGEVFDGRYEVIEEVGRGGMGVVYRARDSELDEEVAMKTLRPELLAEPEQLERFKTETRLARRISHRNVVRTHDIGESAGVYYLTMEFVEGLTVRDLLDTRGQLGVQATLALARQLAEALAVGHDEGIVHRDIKPQNLMLDSKGILKVMDFGVACLAERAGAESEAGVVGTPAYMSPEQLLDEPVDVRSDLFSAGVVLYECLTGDVPFSAPTPVALIAQLLTDEPSSPTDLNSEVPPALSSLIMSLLATSPEERPTGASGLAERLADIA